LVQQGIRLVLAREQEINVSKPNSTGLGNA
jgi:hypothetical protein